MTRLKRPALASMLTILIVASATSSALGAGTTLKNICRVKGLSERTITGAGLVFGLQGTGDGNESMPTIRALAKTMELMGIINGQDLTNQLKSAKNVALVTVTASIPAQGAVKGDKINCRVSAINAKSLAGGRLFTTPLLLEQELTMRNPRVWGLASGNIELDDPGKGSLTAAKVHAGCQIQIDYKPVFVEDNVITLVLDKHIANFSVATDIAETINAQLRVSAGGESSASPDAEKNARAVSSSVIEVPIPFAYLADPSRGQDADPVGFIGSVLSLRIPEPQIEARVVINERAKTIVVSGDLAIGSVVITHGTLSVEAGRSEANRFVDIDTDANKRTPGQPGAQNQQPKAKLETLLDALNAVKVPASDMIEIIKLIDANGKLYGKLIIVE